MLLNEYINLLQKLSSDGWRLCGVATFLKDSESKSVVLRHDVDRREKNAVTMAELEYDMGIRSTYYFRMDERKGFPLQEISKISALGHEVGYHYETLAECAGNQNKALELFATNLEIFRSIAACVTVSMHGRPLSKYNNLDLLRGTNLVSFGLVGDAVLQMSKYKPLYITDVGGGWNHLSANLRDTVPGARNSSKVIINTDDIAQVAKCDSGPIYISTHPERWASSMHDQLYCVVKDGAVNMVKRVIRLVRSNKQ